MESVKAPCDPQAVLQHFGVREDSLSLREREELDTSGIVCFPTHLDAENLERLRCAFDETVEREGAQAGLDHHQEAGSRRIGNLANKGVFWDRVYTHPRLLAAAWHVLRREFRLWTLTGREPLQGFGAQGYHQDCTPRTRPDEPYQAISVMLLLDAFTLDNGPTLLLPGSHARLTPPPKRPPELEPLLPEERLLTAPAGSAVIFNAHLWHAGTTNRSGARRRMLHLAYGDRDAPAPHFDLRKELSRETWERLSPEARYLLDVESLYLLS